MSDRFAYSTPPTAGGRNAEAGPTEHGVLHAGRASMPAEARSTESKQGQDDTEWSDVSACLV